MRTSHALAVLAIVSLFTPVVCGCGDSDGESSASPEPAATLTNEDWAKVAGAPGKYKDTPVKIVGKVFQPPAESDGRIAFQIWADPANSEWNTAVYAPTGTEVAENDYVRVVGVVGDEFTGENLMGAELTVPTIIADSVEVVDALAVAPPALRTVTVNEKQSQYGIVVKLAKVEFAEGETRVHVTVTNGSEEKASFYSFDAKAVQGSKQYSADTPFGVEYPEVESELLPGTKSSGIVVFPEMDPDKATRFVFEASSENWNITLKPYEFRVK